MSPTDSVPASAQAQPYLDALLADALPARPQIVAEGDEARARRDDPLTSHDAADATAAEAEACRAAVLRIHKENPDGLTDWEMTKLYVQHLQAGDPGFPAVDWDTPRRRRSDLTNRGVVIASTDRRPGRTNRPTTVWVLADANGSNK